MSHLLRNKIINNTNITTFARLAVTKTRFLKTQSKTHMSDNFTTNAADQAEAAALKERTNKSKTSGKKNTHLMKTYRYIYMSRMYVTYVCMHVCHICMII